MIAGASEVVESVDWYPGGRVENKANGRFRRQFVDILTSIALQRVQ